jgi:prefoldin alpha subunit
LSDGSEEEELRRLISAYEQYQVQAEAISQQLGLSQVNIEGCDRALNAIAAMVSAGDDQELLVPIGAGSFVHAKLASSDKVVVAVGSGVSIEKTAEEAKETIDRRKSEIVDASKKLTGVLQNIEQEMTKIQSILAKYEQAMGR